MQFRSNNLTHFTNLNSLNIVKIYSRNTAENLPHFTNFPANMFLRLVSEKHLHCAISRHPGTAFSKHLKVNLFIFP